MRLTRLSFCLLLLTACSSRPGVDPDDVDGGADDASVDRGRGGSPGAGGGGSGGTGAAPGKGGTGGGTSTGGSGGGGGFGATGGTGGFGGTGGTGGAGGFGATGGGTGGAGGFGATGGTGGSGGFGGFGGTGGFAGKGGTGGVAGQGGTGGFAGGFGGQGGFAGTGATGGFAGVGGTGGFGGGGGWGGFAGSFAGSGWGGFAGSRPPEAGPDVGPGRPLPPWDDPPCPSGATSPILGTWVGYVENNRFPSGSDALRLTIRAADATTMCGSLTYGDPTPLPAPNPDVGYPPGVDFTSFVPVVPIEGFAHTLHGATVSGKRVRFQTQSYEPFKAWCGLQKSSVKDPWNSTYTCLPSGGWWQQDWTPDGGARACYMMDSFGQRTPIDCGKAIECGQWQVCACNVTGCTADTLYPIDFDAQFEAGEARGSVVLYKQNGTQVFNVYLTKTD
jgi:hypothetical protein